MKTTVNLDDALVQQAMTIYKVKTKRRILEMGLRELIDADGRRKLSEAFGSQPEIKNVPRGRPE